MLPPVMLLSSAYFPTLVGSGANSANASTSTSVSLGATAVAGDLILITAAGTGAISVSGFTTLSSGTFGGGTGQYWVGYKVAAGGETAVTVTSASNGVAGVAQLYRHAGTPTLGAADTSSAWNGPSYSPAGGSRSYYWVSSGAGQSSFASPTPPSDYTDGIQHAVTSSGSPLVSCGCAAKKLAAATEDPGAWNMGSGVGTANSKSFTIAIPPG